MKHADLIDRLKAGSGPDRELDAVIAVILRVPHPDSPDWVDKNFPEWRATPGGHVETVHSDGTGGPHWRPQPFTNSLDACIGLMREVLPEYYRLILIRHEPKLPEGEHWSVGAPVRTNKGVVEINACHEDLCRALLIAILQAVGDAG